MAVIVRFHLLIWESAQNIRILGKSNTFPQLVHQFKNYDIIGGKIANDNTNATITAYMAGTFGEIGTDSADSMCVSLLLPERLRDQFCFRTRAAIDQIQFLESEKICL